MAKATLKTQATTKSVAAFLKTVDPDRRADCDAIAKMMSKATGATPVMWGTAIVGFGKHHFKYASGREGDWFLVGFAPRKANLTLYMTGGFKRRAEFLKKLGKHTGGAGVGCVYIKKLADIDQGVLRAMIEDAVKAPGFNLHS